MQIAASLTGEHHRVRAERFVGAVVHPPAAWRHQAALLRRPGAHAADVRRARMVSASYILAIGRGVTDSLDPTTAARDLTASIKLTEGQHR
ncbi:hypothetical protein Jiend_42990 [Micromonospora endophytica]|nr:hypothetical protein Jiend_42990 [Micromonospora endophytica]